MLLQGGDRLGRYEIVRLLGEGGMGVVYQALLHGPAGFCKPVALKVLKGKGDGLVHEARLGGLLRHPNLVEVYALEQIDGRWVCAMELVQGGALSDVIPLTVPEAVDAVLQACAGLMWAWTEIGLVHLDLKPANLLLSEGRIKVADLGIARARGFSTQMGLGTPAYMAPEQLARARVDSRTDVFALGLVLNALVTGFPRRERDAVPELEPVLARCLVDDPDDRFQTVAELAHALAALDITGAGDHELTLRPAARTPGYSSTSPLTFALDERPRTNLSPALDRFVGRKLEQDRIAAMLGTPGAVLLKGVGGMGKTRLARQVSRRWHLSTTHEAWFCDLSIAEDAAQAAIAVADALGVPVSKAPVGQLAAVLSGRGEILLVLDNCEQIEGLDQLVRPWLEACDRLRILLTSRHRIEGLEPTTVELAPLPTSEASALLAERAPGIDPSDPDVVELAERLDGLPLALELGAARLRMLTPRQVLDRLDQRLKLLARRGTDRHATLRATLDGSFETLDEAERAAMTQLSVFRGGFELEAAEAILDVPSDRFVLDLIGALYERSLLVAMGSTEAPRFGLLETVRVYAAEGLEPGATDRHAEWFAALGTREAIESLDRPGGGARLLALCGERANLERALETLLERGDGPRAVCAARALWQVLELRGPAYRMIPLAERVRELDLDPASRVGALELHARTLRTAGRIQDALATIELAIEGVRTLGDEAWEGLLITARGVIRRRVGELDEGAEDHRRAIEILQRTGHRRGEGDALSNLAAALIYRGELDEPRALLERALAIHRQVGNTRSEALAHMNLGIIDTRNGDPERAEASYQRALELHRSMGDRHFEGLVLGNLTVLYADLGRLDRALATSREALQLHVQVGSRNQEATSRANHASLLAGAGDYEAAMVQFEKAIAMHRTADNPQGVGVSLTYLAEVQRTLGQRAEARSSLDESLEFLERAGDPTWLAVARCRIAALDVDEGLSERAIPVFELELPRLEQMLAQAFGQFQVELARARSATGDRDGARRELDRAMETFRAKNYERDLALALCVLAEIEAAAGDRSAAAEALEQADRTAIGLDRIGAALRDRLARAREALR